MKRTRDHAVPSDGESDQEEEEEAVTGKELAARLSAVSSSSSTRTFGMKQGEALVTIHDPTARLNNPNEHPWTREDGTVAKKTKKGIEIVSPDEEEGGPTYLKNHFEEKAIVDADPQVAWIRLLAGYTHEEVQDLYDRENLANQRFYAEEAKAWNKSERDRIMVGTDVKQKQLDLMELREQTIQSEFNRIRFSRNLFRRFSSSLEVLFNKSGNADGRVGSLPLMRLIGEQYAFLRQMIKLRNDPTLAFQKVAVKEAFASAFPEDLKNYMKHKVANPYLATARRTLKDLSSLIGDDKVASQLFVVQIINYMIIRDQILPKQLKVKSIYWDDKTKAYVAYIGGPAQTVTIQDIAFVVTRDLLALYRKSLATQYIYLNHDLATMEKIGDDDDDDKGKGKGKDKDKLAPTGSGPKKGGVLLYADDDHFQRAYERLNGLINDLTKDMKNPGLRSKSSMIAELERLKADQKELLEGRSKLQKRLSAALAEDSNTLPFADFLGLGPPPGTLLASFLDAYPTEFEFLRREIADKTTDPLDTFFAYFGKSDDLPTGFAAALKAAIVIRFYAQRTREIQPTILDADDATDPGNQFSHKINEMAGKNPVVAQFLYMAVLMLTNFEIADVPMRRFFEVASFFGLRPDEKFNYDKTSTTLRVMGDARPGNPLGNINIKKDSPVEGFSQILAKKWQSDMSLKVLTSEYSQFGFYEIASNLLTTLKRKDHLIQAPIIPYETLVAGPIALFSHGIAVSVITMMRAEGVISLVESGEALKEVLSDYLNLLAKSNSDAKSIKLEDFVKNFKKLNTAASSVTLQEAVDPVQELKKDFVKVTTDGAPWMHLVLLLQRWLYEVWPKTERSFTERIEDVHGVVDALQAEVYRLARGDQASIKPQRDKARELYAPSMQWQMRPEATGRLRLSARVVAAIDEAMTIVRQHVPSLAGASLDALILCNIESGLPGAFARLVAALMNHSQLLWPATYKKDIQYKLDPRVRADAVYALRDYRVDTLSDGTYRARYVGGASSSSSDAYASTGGNTHSVSLFFF